MPKTRTSEDERERRRRYYQEALQEIRSAISSAVNGSRFARYHPNADVEIVVQRREGKLLPKIVVKPRMDVSSCRTR